MVFWKKVPSILLVALLAASMVFANGSAEKGNAAEGGKTEIRLFSHQFGNGNGCTQRFLDAFEAAHPDIHVVLEEYPWDSYWQNIEVRFGAKDPGFDLVVMDVPLVANYAERGLIKNLGEYIPASEFEDKIASTGLPAVRYKGKYYASPMQSSDQYLFINAKYLAEAGIELENVVTKDTEITPEFAEKWQQSALTWDKVVEIAQKLTKDTDGDGINDVFGLHLDQAGQLYQLQPLGGSRGGKIVSEDGQTIKGYFDQPVWLDAIQFYSDLFNKYKVEDPGCFMGRDTTSQFLNGEYAMLIGGGWVIKSIADNGMDAIIAPHPYFADGAAKTPTGSWVLGISSRIPKEKEAAAVELLKWWTLDAEGSQVWYDEDGELPVNKAVLDKLFNDEKYDVFPKSAHRLGAFQVLHTAEARPVSPYFNFIMDGFNQAFRDAAQGTDPETAWKTAIDSITTKIERMK